jgi:hypothetical protein
MQARHSLRATTPPQKKDFYMLRTIACLALLSPVAALAQYSAQAVPTISLSQFKAMQGANVHMEYGDGLYANYQQVINDLAYIGVTHVRDGVPIPNYWASIGVPDIEALMDAGIKFDLISSTQFPACGNPPAATAACATPINTAQINTLLQHKKGSVSSVEGLNEINNEAGVTESEAQSMQVATYSATKANTGLGSTVPVLDFTGLNVHPGTYPGAFDQANIHPYPTQGTEPEATFKADIGENYSTAPTAKAITEFGYRSNPDGGDGVNEQAQADMDLNGLMDAAADGYSSVYYYELLDAYAGDYYGLFHNDDGGPKLIATYLHDLNLFLPNDVASTPKTVMATNSGLPSTVRQLAITASNGDVYLITWDEAPSWNVKTQTYTQEPLNGYYQQVTGTFSSVTISSPAYTGSYGLADNATGTYNGLPYYAAIYTNTPVIMHFVK